MNDNLLAAVIASLLALMMAWALVGEMGLKSWSRPAAEIDGGAQAKFLLTQLTPNGEVSGASRPAGEASTSTVVLDLNTKGQQ